MVHTVKSLLTTSKDTAKSAVIWNMAANILNAFQSVLLLIIMSRMIGQVEAGIFSIGNTTANLFQNIGRYGNRGYQVSDLSRDYNFREYHMSRVISCLVMMITAVAYVLYAASTNNYSLTKTIIVLGLCLNKLPDAYEDVFYGEYQKIDRLDIASKCYALRLLLYIIVVTIVLLVTRNLLISVVISTVINLAICAFFLILTKKFVSENNKSDMKKVWKLLFITLPLCVASFMSYYLNAAPRNSIDRFMTDEEQAIYGYVAMPVFVVNLAVNFFAMPLYYKISVLWDEGKYKEYIKETVKQMFYVVGITLVCILGAWLLGVPVLSIVFGTDLAPYKTELMILMLASGFLGMSNLILGFLTIMRCQNQTLVSYIAVAVIAFLLSDRMVHDMGMRGACLIYLSIMAILVAVFFVLFIIKMIRVMHGADNSSNNKMT